MIDRTIANELGAPKSMKTTSRIGTNLVNLNVSVFNNKNQILRRDAPKNDFKVFENGHQVISYFATTDVPFDLVLLIDLSGATADKRDLIRKTTQSFIAAARPADRLAIVTSADEFRSSLNSPLIAQKLISAIG